MEVQQTYRREESMKFFPEMLWWVALRFTFLFTISPYAYAGSSHFHPKKVAKCAGKCNAEQIKAGAHKGVKELVRWGKMSSDWEKAIVENVEKKTFKKNSRSLTTWVVTLIENTDLEGNNRRYVFFTEDGIVFRTNTTGVLQ